MPRRVASHIAVAVVLALAVPVSSAQAAPPSSSEAPTMPTGDARPLDPRLPLAPPGGASASDDDFRSKAWSLGGLLGFYGALSVWAYFAWYRDVPGTGFHFNGDGLFGADTYAGGADKLGHLWSNHTISRVGSEILIRNGWKRLPASLISSGLSLGFFTLVEVKDGFYYEFSMGDWAADAAGAALSLLMVNVPKVDRLLDFRVEYLPSHEYLDSLTENGDVDVAEDYSGQTYYLAFHLKSIPGLWKPLGYLDLIGGFKSRNYKPEPSDPGAVPTQHLFFGLSLDMQALLAAAVGNTDHGWRRAGHLTFEFLSPPYTTLQALDASRTGGR